MWESLRCICLFDQVERDAFFERLYAFATRRVPASMNSYKAAMLLAVVQNDLRAVGITSKRSGERAEHGANSFIAGNR